VEGLVHCALVPRGKKVQKEEKEEEEEEGLFQTTRRWWRRKGFIEKQRMKKIEDQEVKKRKR